MRGPRVTALATVLAALVAALGGCGGSSAGLVLYNGQHEQTTAAIVTAFERKTGIKVQVRSADEATLGDQLIQEGTASPADVFYTENTPVLEALARRALLRAAPPEALASVPSRYSSRQGLWVGVSGRIAAMVYNTSRLHASQVPDRLVELAAPRFKGMLGFAPTETDFQPLVTSLIHYEGVAAAERWLRGLQRNGTIYPDNETVTAQVNNGESALGPINHYYWFRLRASLGAGEMHSALRYFRPGDPGDLLDVSGAAVLRSAHHVQNAERFVRFLVSREGQEAIARSTSFEYPLRPGVPPSSQLTPLRELRPLGLTPAELGTGAQALALEQKLGLL
ncbi:MAG TPA: extracellular solute-binding protein [Solirubrobacteraceae bacterium]|nr:extracellular solute-binding protein [Solirubrobacteraceae bacterium]